MSAWVRLWEDMPNDPKWRVVARRAGRPVSEVLAVFLHMMVNAGAAADRGNLESWSDEDIAIAIDADPQHVRAIREAMQGKTLEGDHLTGWEKRQPKREDGAAERAKAWRERQKVESNALQTQENTRERRGTVQNATEPPEEKRVDTESSSLRSDENNRRTPRKAEAVLDALKTVLDPEVAAGVIEHRRSLRKPLTLLAAQGLAKAFSATADPNSAARMMIERGWQGFQPEWMENHRVPNGHGRPPTRAGPTTGQLMMEAVQGKFTESLIRDGYAAAEDRTGEASIAGRDRQSGD